MSTNEALMEKIMQSAGKGLDCSQIVFGTFSPEFGLESDAAEKIAAAFGGGMFQGETCGAVSGALMALGLKYGHDAGSDPEVKERMQAKTAEFQKRFAEKNGTCICRELLGYKIPEEMESIMAENKFGTVCPYLIRDAINICEEMLEDD